MKDLSYQVDKAEKVETDEDEDEEEETISEWVKMLIDKFNAIRGAINRNANDGLSTKVGNKSITLNNAKK